MNNVRVRFAPSPTGPLHIGGVRTALYNYLFAKKHNGKFIIRIEDTDQQRLVSGAEKYIHDSLNWLGLEADESVEVGGSFAPYKQSERSEIYKKYIQQILQTDFAYIAFDTNEELDALRKEYESKGDVFAYGIATRNQLKNSISLSKEEVQRYVDSNIPYVVRFKMPENRMVEVNDIIRGTFSVDTKTLDDKVLFKTDGLPTYHFANIVDDHTMEISHVIRGEEWLPSLPLHLLLYEAMNWEAPKFAHLPLILKPAGNGKLSKRDGDKYGFPVFPLNFTDSEGNTSIGYKEFGYVPEAVINLLALIGWSNKDNQELFTLQELIEQFDLEEVHKSGARFNPDKAVWFNHEYIQKQSNATLVSMLEQVLAESNLESNSEKNQHVIAIVKERLDFVHEIVEDNEKGKFFYIKPMDFQEKDIAKVVKEDTKFILEKLCVSLQSLNEWNEEQLSLHLKNFATENEIGLGKIMMPIRLSIVGEMKGPDVPKSMEILGKQETLDRISHFQSCI